MPERTLSRYRDGSEYVLTIDLPGIPREDIEVSWDQGRLHVVAEHANEERTEVVHELATFSREIDPGGITAAYGNGTLEVSLPIRKAGPRGMSVAIESVTAEPDGQPETADVGEEAENVPGAEEAGEGGAGEAEQEESEEADEGDGDGNVE